MIHNICNIGDESNISTFNKIVIYEASQFIKFDRFLSNLDLDALLKELPDSAQVFFTDLLPQNIRVSNRTTIKNSLETFKTSINFVITPQSEERHNILKTYNNKEVFVLLIKPDNQHLYGTSKEPLLFKFDELHSNKPGDLKGFTINMNGTSIEAPRYVSTSEYNIFSRTLAFELAQKI